jgi:hypothetical protein
MRELATLTSWAACIAGAGTADRYADLLAAAGLQVEHIESHDEAVARAPDRQETQLSPEAGRRALPGDG